MDKNIYKKELLKTAEKNILRKSESFNKGEKIKGYDFSKGLDYDKLLEHYSTTGFQATHLAKAISIIKEMRKAKARIFLGYTSNMITSGLRDIIRYLVEKKYVDVLVTTTGGVEEDIMKCMEPFLVGDFEAKGALLRKKGINRTGNIFVPNDRYCKFEDFCILLLEKLYQRQKNENVIQTPSSFIWELGEAIKDKSSIYYWAQKNKIPVFCPAITDGSIGDMIYFFKYKRPEFLMDVSDDIVKMNNLTMEVKKTGIIILGAGVVKHHICNANMFRNGADYAVYINTAQEFDGSDSGARPDEAVSWGKILPNANTIKVFCDATIAFPLIVSKAFFD